MRVGKALKLVMTMWHISNYRLSQLSGVGKPTIGKLIRGEHQSTSWDKVEQLANGLEQVHLFAKVAFLEALSLPDDAYEKLRNVDRTHEPFYETEGLDDIAFFIRTLEILGLIDLEIAEELRRKMDPPFPPNRPLFEQLEFLLMRAQMEMHNKEVREKSNE